MIPAHNENSYTGLQNKQSVERNGSQQQEERKEEESSVEKDGARTKIRIQRAGERMEMESVKKEKICSGSPLSSLCATNTSIIPDA